MEEEKREKKRGKEKEIMKEQDDDEQYKPSPALLSSSRVSTGAERVCVCAVHVMPAVIVTIICGPVALHDSV